MVINISKKENKNEELINIKIDLTDVRIDKICKSLSKIRDEISEKEENGDHSKLYELFDGLYEYCSIMYQQQFDIKSIVTSKEYRKMVQEEQKLLLKSQKKVNNKKNHSTMFN